MKSALRLSLVPAPCRFPSGKAAALDYSYEPSREPTRSRSLPRSSDYSSLQEERRPPPLSQRNIGVSHDGADPSGDCGRRGFLPSRGSGAQARATGGTQGTAGTGQQSSLEHTSASGPRQQASLECARASGLGVHASTGLPRRDFSRASGVNARGSSSRRRTGPSDSDAHIGGSNRWQSDSELRLGVGSNGHRQHNESRMKEEHEAFILRRRSQVCAGRPILGLPHRCVAAGIRHSP